MATNPTRKQAQARDLLADILNQTALAIRLDGNPKADAAGFADLSGRIARLSSAFALDEIVARALEKRALALGLPSGLAEMLALLDAGISPLNMLRLDDEAFVEQARKAEEELG